MSLNGLDDSMVVEAHEAATSEPGGWYVTKPFSIGIRSNAMALALDGSRCVLRKNLPDDRIGFY